MSRRQSHCFVPGCKSGYKSSKGKFSLFGVPKEEAVFQQWQRNIPRAHKPLPRNAAVCELHFDEQFVSRHFEHVVDGKSVLIEESEAVSFAWRRSDHVSECAFLPVKTGAQEKKSQGEVVPTACAS
ncbi:hypothetical protein HPB48_008906 [Haemaphysalis longicornis]|uniref:THAP-type domain-containing protein n=1 Tax=Haemaphysalis longicornis TaxID=44386 RepID=A0A9J6FGL8_HAELO|nr:hypothetical protein HPB48_008906 [Haemaphysalis longicornis]